MQVRDGKTGRLLGDIHVPHEAKKFDRFHVVAVEPNPAGFAWNPRAGAIPRYFRIDLRFAEWRWPDGRVERVLVNDSWTVEDLLKTNQFVPAEQA